MKSIIAAIIKFQKEVPAIPKNSFNPHFKSKYAELSTCLDVCLPVLNKHGLTVIQGMRAEDNKNMLATKLCHESGEFIESVIYLPDIQDAQKLTSAITYLRRSSFLSIIGLVAEDDLDGNSISDDKQPSTPRSFNDQGSKPLSNGTPASDAQKGLMRKLKIEFADSISKSEANALINKYNEGKK